MKNEAPVCQFDWPGASFFRELLLGKATAEPPDRSHNGQHNDGQHDGKNALTQDERLLGETRMVFIQACLSVTQKNRKY